MKKQSQGQSKREAARARQAAEPNARFLLSRCEHEIEANTVEDVAIVRRTFGLHRF